MKIQEWLYYKLHLIDLMLSRGDIDYKKAEQLQKEVNQDAERRNQKKQ